MRITLILILITTSSIVFCQNIQDRIAFPDTLWAENDSFYVKATSWENQWNFSTTMSDTIDLGTDGYKGIKIKVWTDTDTLNIPYVNSPNEQWIYIPIASMKDTTIYRLRFNPQNSVFTKSYINQNLKTITFQIPEVYELANIILYLTECSESTRNHPMDTEYSKRVNEHFNKFRNHRLIQILNSKCLNNNHWTTYYGFRENSICFKFDEDNFLRYSTPYKHVWSDNSQISGGEFRNLLYLVQDFVDKTDFRTFYNLNTDYYESLEKRQSELQPISKMWKWLEKEFPQRYDHYKVIFSPLIAGSHSTQEFYKGNYRDPIYQECIMFINSSESLDSNIRYDENLKIGLSSGVVFTEIDHNYINPTSLENIKEIKQLISEKDKWATKEAQKNYSSEYAIFNEYMTHSIFCLYIDQIYNGNIKDQIIEKRVQLMKRRGFLKFDTFNSIIFDELRNRNGTIYKAYPELINLLKEIE